MTERAVPRFPDADPPRDARRRRRRGPAPHDPPTDGIDLTPMIDVTFQLIVFLLVANDLSRKDIVDLELPASVAAVEDFVPQDDVRVVLNLRRPARDGAEPDIVFAGRRVDERQLRRVLRTAADRSREDGPGSPSNVYALLRADREVPWQHVQRVLQVCGAPDVRIYRLQIAAERSPDAEPVARGGVR